MNEQNPVWIEGEPDQVRASLLAVNGRPPETVDLLHRVPVPDGPGYDLLILRADGELAMTTNESGVQAVMSYDRFLEMTEVQLPDELVELDRRYRARKSVFKVLARAGRLYDVELGIRDSADYLPDPGPSPVSYDVDRDELEVRVRDGHVQCTSALDIAGTWTYHDADMNDLGYTIQHASRNSDLIVEALKRVRKERGYE
ncbi:hypothetical protein N826_25465 [Skermanella aerolata KACC 11604]|nr:hypothetical protein N826_25465 [Skermanella aerolata KACC 11604]